MRRWTPALALFALAMALASSVLSGDGPAPTTASPDELKAAADAFFDEAVKRLQRAIELYPPRAPVPVSVPANPVPARVPANAVEKKTTTEGLGDGRGIILDFDRRCFDPYKPGPDCRNDGQTAQSKRSRGYEATRGSDEVHRR